MIGIFLLIIALLLYFNGNKKWSLLLFVGFTLNGMTILTDGIIGIKNKDLAFIYTIIISTLSILNERKNIWQDQKLLRSISIFFVFLLCSALYSYFHYGYTLFQILQGGRYHFLFLSYFFLIKTSYEDIEWILQKLFIITFFTSILYAAQVISGLPFLPYDLGEALVDQSTGFYRYYNSPPLITLFIFVSILIPTLIKSKLVRYAPYILLLAQILTLGRLEIATTLTIIFIGLLLKGKVSKLSKWALIFGICIMPMTNIILSRINSHGETNSDIQEIVTGQFRSRAFDGDMTGATMSYRFAWIYERILYLNNRPLGENIFGLGMISDSQEDIINRRFRFQLGLIDKETGQRTQLVTPDIAYGNFITQFGYLGGVFLLVIWLRLMVLSYRKRKKNPWALALFLVIIGYLIRSMSGSIISSTSSLVIPFLILSLLYQSPIRKITDS